MKSVESSWSRVKCWPGKGGMRVSSRALSCGTPGFRQLSEPVSYWGPVEGEDVAHTTGPWGFEAKTLGTKNKATNILSDELYRLINTDSFSQQFSVLRSRRRMMSISGFSNLEEKWNSSRELNGDLFNRLPVRTSETKGFTDRDHSLGQKWSQIREALRSNSKAFLHQNSTFYLYFSLKTSLKEMIRLAIWNGNSWISK